MFKKKKIIIPVIAIAVLLFVIFSVFLKKNGNGPDTVAVKKGTVVQEISETGNVQKGEKINLNFKNSGRIEAIYVEEGDMVSQGKVLAKLDTVNEIFQLQEARAAQTVAQANYDKLVAGATEESIRISSTTVNNAKIAFEDAQESLKDVKTGAEADLSAVYEDIQNILNDAYLKSYNALNEVISIQTTYFNGNNQECIAVRDKKSVIQNSTDIIKSYLSDSDIEGVAIKTKEELSKISDALKIIRESCESGIYANTVSSTDKSSLDTHRTNINTAITNVTDNLQDIFSAKITNETNINVSEAKVSAAEGAFIKAQDEYDSPVAPPRKEDINLYQAQVDQAKSQVQILENKIYDASLKSPVKGQIAAVNKRQGEVIMGGTIQDYIFIILPEIPFEIKSSIYEEDIVLISIGDEVEISLPAFPERVFIGRVASINPAEKMIEEAVYYEVSITFDETPPEGVMPGMTADIVIKAEKKENILVIPEEAIRKIEGKKFVDVLIGEKSEEREIKTGLYGSEDLVEVLSGLKEGEKVIIQ